MQITEQGRQNNDFLTIAQLIISGFGLVLALISAGLLLVVGLAALFSETLDPESSTTILSAAWVSGLLAALALPSLIYSFRRTQGEIPQPSQAGRLRLATFMLLVWPLALALGDLIASQGTLTWLLLPPLHLLVIGLPIWWIVELARWRLPAESRQRKWGAINFSLFITTPVVIVVELIVFVVLLVLFAVWASSRPDIVTQFEILAQRILTSQPNPESILRVVRPYFKNPLVITSILALLAGLVPLIEEMLKPLALFALANRRLTPAGGFIAGALCGGSFALLESLLSLTGPVQDSWAVVAIGRAGTGLLHTLTTALIGWALAYAWQNGSYIRLGLTYLFSAALHGLWNALSVLSGLSVLLENPPDNLHLMASISQVAPYGIIILVLLLLVLLAGWNRRLQQTSSPTGPNPPGAVNADVSQSL